MIFPGGISWSPQCKRSSKCVKSSGGGELYYFHKANDFISNSTINMWLKKVINNNLIFYYSVPNMDLLLKAQIRRKLSPHKTSGQTTPQSRTTHNFLRLSRLLRGPGCTSSPNCYGTGPALDPESRVQHISTRTAIIARRKIETEIERKCNSYGVGWCWRWEIEVDFEKEIQWNGFRKDLNCAG